MALTASLAGTAQEIGEQAAGPAADEVDRDARFPAEALAEVRSAGLLGALVPSELGGPGHKVGALAGAVSALSGHCASSGLILAMHSIQVATAVRHASREALDRLVPGLLSGELLLANANSEVGLGGERRASICALEPAGDGFRLVKQAATVSYGENADGILATARRTPDSPANEQIMAICLPPALKLTPSGGWNTLGLRGTRSRPGLIEADVAPEMIIDDYADVFARTAVPTSAILLGSVWLGLAEAAARRAHGMVRAQARRTRAADANAAPPPSAMRLAELGVVLHQAREVMAGAIRAYEGAIGSDEVVSLGFVFRMDNVKLAMSSAAVEISRRAMAICGMGGYSNDSPVSLARITRDSAAAPLMINNDRVLAGMAQSLLIRKEL